MVNLGRGDLPSSPAVCQYWIPPKRLADFHCDCTPETEKRLFITMILSPHPTSGSTGQGARTCPSPQTHVYSSKTQSVPLITIWQNTRQIGRRCAHMYSTQYRNSMESQAEGLNINIQSYWLF